MNYKLFLLSSILMSVLAFFAGLYFSSHLDFLNIFLLQDKSASPFGYGSFVAILNLLILFMGIIIPKIDPLKPDFKKFAKEYYLMIFSTELFVLYIFVLDLFYNFNFQINYVSSLALGFAVLFWFSADLMSKVKRSWFIGIRTPWTMKSDFVFEATNKMASKLFRFLAGFSVLGFLLGDSCLYFSVIPLFIVMVFIFFYSSSVYQGQKI